MLKNRPRAPKKYLANYHSGNEYRRTPPLKVEYFSGDVMKIIGDCCHQLQEYDGFQKDEILKLVESYLNKHIDDGEEIG